MFTVPHEESTRDGSQPCHEQLVVIGVGKEGSRMIKGGLLSENNSQEREKRINVSGK